jgi:hypothetical protein
MQEGKDLFKIGLGASHPAIPEIFKNNHRNPRGSSETLGKVGLSRADRTAEKVAHGHGGEFVTTPEFKILLEPSFDTIESNHIIK